MLSTKQRADLTQALKDQGIGAAQGINILQIIEALLQLSPAVLALIQQLIAALTPRQTAAATGRKKKEKDPEE